MGNNLNHNVLSAFASGRTHASSDQCGDGVMMQRPASLPAALPRQPTKTVVQLNFVLCDAMQVL